MRILRVRGIPNHHHSLIGGNFRIDEIQAAVLAINADGEREGGGDRAGE